MAQPDVFSAASAARALNDAERLDWLRLYRSENVGPVTFARLIARYGTAARALDALPTLARRGGARRYGVASKGDTEREIETGLGLGARLVARCEPDYPPLLTQADDAPAVIWVRGHGHLLAKRAVAVVGARNASLNGRKLAQTIAAEIGAGGFLVVSGLARGIDAAAHTGALATGTAAVIAGGIDVIYPAENADLFARIVDEGVMIAEQAPGTKPQARDFPRRNRIIAAMARATLVVEASLRSGSLITARLATDYGREVFAVPGSPLDPRARGGNRLLRDGAALIESGQDVLDALTMLGPAPLGEPQLFDFAHEIGDNPDPEAVEETRAALLVALGPTPVPVDELVRHGQFSPATVATVLLEFELAGRLERHPGNQVALIEGPPSLADS